MSGLVDSSPPGGSIVPYRNFTPPPETPDKLAVSVTPGSRDQYAIDSDKRPMPPPGPYLDTNGQLVQPSSEQVAALPTPAGQPTDLTKPDVAKPENAHAQALDYVTRTRQLEGSGKDPRSSAVGGFIDSTWLDTIHKIRPETLNMPPEQVLAMRYDESPAGIALRDQATAQYASENSGALQKAGLPVNPTNLRLAHFLGPGGAVQVLSVPPSTLMSEINPKAVAANPTLQGRTAGEVIQLANDQMNGNTAANMRRTALGPFNEGASAFLQTWQQDIQKRGKEYDDALAEGKDLRKVARAAMAKWELSSEHPPQDMRDNWNQWAGAAIGLAMLGGFFGKNHTAAINAAGEMLQAANQADVRAYDIAYKRWKDHNDNGLKLIELLHGEARDIVEDARKSYDQKITELGTLSTAYQLQQHLDPASLENVQKQLEIERSRSEVIKIQNVDSAARDKDQKWLADHPEVKEVPAGIHNQHVGEATREASGTAGAAADAIKAQVYSNTLAAEISRWVAANPGKTESDIPPEDFATMQQRAASVSGYVRGAGAAEKPINVTAVTPDGKTVNTAATYDPATRKYTPVGSSQPFPEGTKVTLKGTAAPRSAPAIAMNKFMEEHPGAGFEAVAMAAARIRALGAMEQAFGSGAQGNTIRSLNVAIDHTDVLQQLADALQNKDTTKLNALKNRVLVEFGYEGPVDFDVAKKIVADELVKAVLGNNAGTGAERLELQADFDRSSSPEQLKGVIQTARRLMLGQMRGLEFQYAGQDEKRQGTFREKLFDHTKESLETTDKAGKSGAGASATPPAEGGIVIQNGWRYDAKTHEPLGPVQ